MAHVLNLDIPMMQCVIQQIIKKIEKISKYMIKVLFIHTKLPQMSFYIDIENTTTFDEIVNNAAVCIVDFHAVWCLPCKKLSPLLKDEVLKNPDLNKHVSSDKTNVKNKIVFLKVDVDTNQELANKFKVSSIPMIVFYKDGKNQNADILGTNVKAIMLKIQELSNSLNSTNA